MPTEVALTNDEIAPLIKRLVVQCSLFQGIDRAALADLVQRVGHRLHLARGHEQELRVGIDETFDEPRACHPIHMDTRPRNPAHHPDLPG